MSSNAWKIVGAVGVVCMLVCAIVAVAMDGCTTLIECESGSFPMKCHWAFQAVMPASIVAVVAFVCAMVTKSAEAHRACAALALVAVAAVALIPTDLVIGLCSHADSACHGTANIVWVLCAVAAVVSIVMLVKADPADAAKPKMHDR